MIGRCARNIMSLGAVGAVVACTREPPTAPITAFEMALAQEYGRLADDELAESDFADWRRFSRNQRAAAAGDPPAPDDLEDRDLDEPLRAEIQAARARLVTAQDEIARLAAPSLAARAQAGFDCWVQESEERLGQPEIEMCRRAFFDDVAALEQSGSDLIVLLPSTEAAAIEVSGAGDGGVILLDEPLQAAVTSPVGVAATPRLDQAGVAETLRDAAAAEPPAFASYLVFFDVGGADITADSLEAFNAAIADAGGRDAARVTVFGHTDTVGAQSFNVTLSRSRAEQVAAALVEAGLPPDAVDADSFGETRLLVETPDSVSEPRNRRVEIVVR